MNSFYRYAAALVLLVLTVFAVSAAADWTKSPQQPPVNIPGHVWAYVPGVGYTFITPADLDKLRGARPAAPLAPCPLCPTCPNGRCPLQRSL